jgi:MFS family permease
MNRNIRFFIAFRLFFNARFYYPVFAILFLDFGLTIEHFALLNAVWAATIVLMEVPSGALADVLGRRRLVIFSAMLMAVEIGLLCIVPVGYSTWLLGVFLINRILSGTAEASASGADEALAYDSLKREGKEGLWGTILEKQIRWQSIGFIFAMSLGAALYDPELLLKLTRFFGHPLQLTQQETLRFPLYLTLGSAFLALFCAVMMKEGKEDVTNKRQGRRTKELVQDSFRLTFQAGTWIMKTPFVLVVILSGMLFDHVIRMCITLNSQYLRLIELPEASFGVIGSGLSLLGLFVPRIANQMADRFSPDRNFIFLCLLTMTGLVGMTRFWPLVGLFPVVLLYITIISSGFFMSFYLNRCTDSGQRATVLSFKGLSFNLAYGMIGLLYAVLMAMIRASMRGETIPRIENQIFIESFQWFPGYFLLVLCVLVFFARRQLRGSSLSCIAGESEKEKP